MQSPTLTLLSAKGFHPGSSETATLTGTVVHIVKGRALLTESKECCSTTSQFPIVDSPFCEERGAHELASYLESIGMDKARLQLDGDVMQKLLNDAGKLKRCAITRKNGKELELCPKALSGTCEPYIALYFQPQPNNPLLLILLTGANTQSSGHYISPLIEWGRKCREYKVSPSHLVVELTVSSGPYGEPVVRVFNKEKIKSLEVNNNIEEVKSIAKAHAENELGRVVLSVGSNPVDANTGQSGGDESCSSSVRHGAG